MLTTRATPSAVATIIPMSRTGPPVPPMRLTMLMPPVPERCGLAELDVGVDELLVWLVRGVGVPGPPPPFTAAGDVSGVERTGGRPAEVWVFVGGGWAELDAGGDVAGVVGGADGVEAAAPRPSRAGRLSGTLILTLTPSS